MNKIKIATLSIVGMDLPLALEFVEHRPVMGFDINTNCLSAVKPVAMVKGS